MRSSPIVFAGLSMIYSQVYSRIVLQTERSKWQLI